MSPPLQPLPPEYLVQHIQDALATDPRARELGVDVRVVGTSVVLTGSVSTPDQRSSIGVVVTEVLQREAGAVHDVVNELSVTAGGAGPVEELA